MKKILSIIAILLQGFACYSQGAGAKDTSGVASLNAASLLNSDAAIHKLKSSDAVLPRFAIDFNYRAGVLSQSIEMIDMRTSYDSSSESSKYVYPTFNNGRTSGGDVQLSYFFNRRRTIGISIGSMYLKHTGTFRLDTLYADFQAKFNKQGDKVYRQMIHLNSPLTEDISINNINIPLMLQFKHQFGKPSNPSNLGITAGFGGLFGISNETRTLRASGSFDYEAVYRISSDSISSIDGYPHDINTNHSLILTKNSLGDDKNYFDSFRADPEHDYNVGIGKTIGESWQSGTARYTSLGLGAIVQLGLSYTLSYNVAFQLNGYFIYQSWMNTGNEKYHVSDRVVSEPDGKYYANYYSLTKGIKQSDYTAYGLSAGFRIYFGEKRDVDGDKIPDATDRCKLEYGEARFNGCPDTDGDGIVDDQDACKFEKGPEYTNGCPDRDADGVPDKTDKCPDEYGELRNGCPVVVHEDSPIDTTVIISNNGIQVQHILLETNMLLFDFGKADIKDSASGVLDYAAKILDNNPDVVVHIGGFTDDIGTYKNNLALSYERSKAARAYLLKKGIGIKRIIISGYGKDNPLNTNGTPEDRAKNRRIELKLLLPI